MRHIFLFEDIGNNRVVGDNIISALRRMADAIEKTNDYYKGIPD